MKLLPAGFEADIIIGADEAGRGALAGPIVGAAVAVPPHDPSFLHFIADSKSLTHNRRKLQLPEIVSHVDAYSVVSVPASLIDKLGIQYCNRLVLEKAIFNVLKVLRDSSNLRILVLIDHLKLTISQSGNIQLFSVPKADSEFISVAMASVLAKCTRDLLIEECQELFPDYNFKKHRGYGTKEHLGEIRAAGASKIHRSCFKPISQMKLF